MAEFTARKTATYSPTKCVFCGTHEGPFVDTHLELLGYGHVWVCMANEHSTGCVRQMARLDGMFDPQEREELMDEIINLTHRLDEAKDVIREKRVPLGKMLEVLS